ncbi:MAG TPA: hypothetical protein VNH17_15080 [Streptosporangiaceae bacterium]|nr:hypothetical protein [Streptosporangiaceae bacterium]
MTGDEELREDIADLPLRTRWRYTLRPAPLRYAINRVWPGRWSGQEIDQIMRRARQRAAELQENVE